MQQRPQTAAQPPVRLRFAPRPGGPLHLGAARTALFNWLWARKLGGVFVLRIADTDARRSSDESMRDLLAGMRWLGLGWDEGLEIGGPFGPYQQALRQVLYHAEVDRLLRQGSAYRCFCAPADEEPGREGAVRAGKPRRCDGGCRRCEPADGDRRAATGEKHVVRLRMPDEGDVGWIDLVGGELRFRRSALDDCILLGPDGNPTASFAVVVDDVKMRISHVIRGEDEIATTPQQLVLFDALGYPRPEFAHLPRIVGTDADRLSPRHGALSVTQFRDRGILPQAMLNYLALLGWSYDGQHEVLTSVELVTHFDLKNVSRDPAVFDLQKLLWLNHEHFVRLPLGAKIEAMLPQMKAHGLWPPRCRVELGPTRHFRVVTGGHDDKVAASIQPVPEEEWMRREPTLAEELPRLAQILDAVGDRLGGPHDAAEVLACFYTDDFAYDPEAVAQHLATEETAVLLEALAAEFEALQPYTPENLEAALRGLAERFQVKPGALLHAARVAVTGRAVSPGIFEVLYLVGRAKVVERLRRGRDIVRHDRELGALPPSGAAETGPPGPATALPPPPPGSEPPPDAEFADGAQGDEPPRGDA